ncbi:hypothetical protein TNCV_4667851 [Trichonephila clavipes]|nr:hypothetical protein TNCV_4667851 [Trichonephila clavipes]
MNETVPPDSKVIDLRKIITGSENYEEGFVKCLLDMVMAENEKAEREKEWEREKAKAEFELEKLRTQNFSIKTEYIIMHEYASFNAKLKKEISVTTQEHFIDDWSNLINPEELADKLDAYENM